LEQVPTSNIHTASDALWWSFVTITTVGYGDTFPVTDAGRLLGAFLMAVGVGLFGTVTALFASWFMGADGERDPLDKIRAELAEIKGLLGDGSGG
jgi:voltage-gated potassium channel